MDNDFFSQHFPLTVFENFQRERGLKTVLRPKDLEITGLLTDLDYLSSENILDFGCAGGVWLERLLTGTKIKGYGVDISPRLINYAKKVVNHRGEYYLANSSWNIAKTIDFVVSFDVFEHIEDKKREIKNIYNSMKPGGKFLFYVMNPNHKFTFDWLVALLGSDYLYKRANHNITLFPNPKEFKNILGKGGFINIKYKLFEGPANLFWDVFCFTYLSFLDRLFGGRINLLSNVLLWLNDKLVRLIFPINNMIDKLFLKSGNSNGYFIYGEKPKTYLKNP